MRKKQAALIIDCRQALNLPNTTYLIKPIMKRNFKPMAALAVCALGALAVSSCTKDEFFGLEDSVVIDASTKYEIAMSQEFADYARASFKFAESVNQEVDTTKMNSFSVDGKTVYYKDDNLQKEMFDLLDALKKAYPELNKADRIDYEEIQQIALSNNEALKDIAQAFAGTKGSNLQAVQWLSSAYKDMYGYEAERTSLFFWEWSMYFQYTVQSAIWDASFIAHEGDYLAGGLIWGDGTAVSMVAYGPEGSYVWWPNTSGYGSPQPEADFIILPSYMTGNEIDYWVPGFNSCGRSHMIFGNEEMYYY